MREIPTQPTWHLLGRDAGGDIKIFERCWSEDEAKTRLKELSSTDSNLDYCIDEGRCIVPDRTLPTPGQVQELCQMLHHVLVAIRMMGYGGKTEAIIDFTDRLHNLPKEMFEPANWDWNLLEASLVEFESRFPEDSSFRFSETVREIRNPDRQG